MTEIQRIQVLRELLHSHNYNYYVKNAPTITDREFDELLHELQQLEEAHPEAFDANSPTQRVGSDLNNEFVQVRHEYPMLSLGNTYNREEVAAFYHRIQNLLREDNFQICCELKFDGLSISLIYAEGKLVRAVTRGDGVQGDDVTANVRTIKSIPLVLKEGDYPDRFEIRGEILMPWASFEQLNLQREAAEEPLFANPRNAASGTLKSKNSAVVAQRMLDAYLYYIPTGEEVAETHFESLRRAAEWGFKISEHTRLANSLEEIYQFIDYWDVERKSLPVATDGIVLKVNAFAQQETLGYTAKTPRWAIAYKFAAERALTRLNEVTYQVGRTGAITPVANMNPVQLSGTVVKRASLHNENIIQQLDLHLGDMVYVEKAGEIIPQIVDVERSARDASLGEKVEFITHCPDCGTALVKYEGEAAHYCPNDSGCPPQLKAKIEHFISRDCMNIDSLGPETANAYFERGLIYTPADLYAIRMEDIIGVDGTREVSARKVLNAIEKSKTVEFERVLFALGIRFVGKVVARNIARHFKSMEAIAAATEEELLQAEGVGAVIAASVRRFFDDERNKALVEALKTAGLQMKIEEAERLSDKLAGKSIVISGTFARHSREEYKAMIEANGGKNVGSISKKTSFVLAGENMGSSKLEKARSLDIPLMDEEGFLQLLADKIVPVDE